MHLHCRPDQIESAQAWSAQYQRIVETERRNKIVLTSYIANLTFYVNSKTKIIKDVWTSAAAALRPVNSLRLTVSRKLQKHLNSYKFEQHRSHHHHHHQYGHHLCLSWTTALTKSIPPALKLIPNCSKWSRLMGCNGNAQCRVITIPVRDNNWYSNWMRNKLHRPTVQQTNVILNLKVINIYQLKSIIELDWSLVSVEYNLGVLSRCLLLLVASPRVSSQMLDQRVKEYLGIGRKSPTPQRKIQFEIHSTSSTYCISIFVFIFISMHRSHHPVWWERCDRDRNEMMMTPTKRNTEFNLILYLFFPYCMMSACSGCCGLAMEAKENIIPSAGITGYYDSPLAMSLRCFFNYHWHLL